MTASTIATATARTDTRASTGRIALAALLAAVISGAVNASITLIAVALGVTATQQLTPAVDIAFSVFASIAGAIGWTIVSRRAVNPRRVMRVLAPAVLLVSFIPDIGLGEATVSTTGIAPVLTLALMHVTTIVIAVAAYRRVLPLRPWPAVKSRSGGAGLSS